MRRILTTFTFLKYHILSSWQIGTLA